MMEWSINARLYEATRQGIEQGLEQGKIETAIAMIEDGLDLAIIAKYVQMPISWLEEIKEKYDASSNAP